MAMGLDPMPQPEADEGGVAEAPEGEVPDEHLTACDGCGRVWDSAVPHECYCICKDGDPDYEVWRDATKAEAFLYHGWWRAVEQGKEWNGVDLTKGVHQRLDAMTKALNERNWDKGWKNLIGATAYSLTYAMANGRWAVLVGRKNEELRGLLREAAILLPMLAGYESYDLDALLSRIETVLAEEEPPRPDGNLKGAAEHDVEG